MFFAGVRVPKAQFHKFAIFEQAEAFRWRVLSCESVDVLGQDDKLNFTVLLAMLSTRSL